MRSIWRSGFNCGSAALGLCVNYTGGVKSANIEVVFEPQWTQSMMSEAARLQLGMG